MKVILYQPQIPQNTGNIIRTCAVTGNSLIMVAPLGFSTSNRMLKRAGLDYWNDVSIEIIEDLYTYLENSTSNFYFFSSKANKYYTECKYNPDDLLIFGSETEGLQQKYLERWPQNFCTLPMIPNSRCLNLSNSVSIAVYEAWRQQNFTNPLRHD